MKSWDETFVTLVAVSVLLLLPNSLDAEIFSDGFESGDVSAWTTAVGYLPGATVFRLTDADLRDPHVFVEGLPGACLDVTDDDLPFGLGPSFNDSLEESMTTDTDGDDLLDLTTLFLFRPFDLESDGRRLDLDTGRCSAPMATTSCDPEPLSEPVITAYDSRSDGVFPCLETIAGTTSGYSPMVSEPAGSCFVSEPRTASFDLGMVVAEVVKFQAAGTWVEDPVSGFSVGLMRGFLSEESADSILLPPEVPIVGGQPLSILFPGGTGNCAAGDDRDVDDGVIGWWLYWQVEAELVPYTGR